MRERGLYLCQGTDGTVYVQLERDGHVIVLDSLLPPSLQGQSFAEIKENKSVGQFFDLTDMILISAEAMHAHMQSVDVSGVSKNQSVQTKLPPFDLDYLKLRTPSGEPHPERVAELLSIIGAYWESPHGSMGIKSGLVAGPWRRGMSAADIIRYIQTSTGKDGHLMKASGRGHDIMHTVVDAYLESKGLPINTEVSQTEMGLLIERWLTATRNAPLKSKDATNSVLHWADYRRLGLVDQSGTAQDEQVRQVALQVFSRNAATFAELVTWVDAQQSVQKRAAIQQNNAARALLKKKRKQGKLNRKRGRR